MPLQRHEIALRRAEDRIGATLLGEVDGEEADLWLRPRIHARSQGGGEELDAEADAPVGLAPTNGFADDALLVGQPR